jgi:hypothetical protein
MLREGQSSFSPCSFPGIQSSAEVESIVEAQVRSIIDESPSDSHHRITLVSKLIDALESDAAWVEMYGITGELAVPSTLKEEGEIGELLREATKVRGIHKPCSQLITMVLAFGRT